MMVLMARKLKLLTASTGLALASFGAQATPIVSVLDGSTVDLSGNFIYALTMNPFAAGTSVGDATFTSALNGSTSGVSVSNQNYIQNWHTNAATAGAGLDSVMKSIIWSVGNGSQVVTLSMSNLQVGATYKAQLMFGEACCDRGFDIFQDGVLVADDFSPFALSGNSYSGNALFSNTFVAQSAMVTFGLGDWGGHGDWNPILNAATLEAILPVSVPEPAPLSLLLAGLGLAFVSRRNYLRA